MQSKKILLERITQQIHEFPGYAKIFKVALIPESWSVANEMLTPTLKLKRSKIAQHYSTEIENLYTKR